MASASELNNAIEPGSMPFGERQAFENLAGQLGPSVAPSPAAADGQALTQQFQVPSNPLDMLLGGDIAAGGPVTSGLGVGPGPGPLEGEVPDDRIQRLRIVALTAKSPVMREIARRTLRRLVGRDTLA